MSNLASLRQYITVEQMREFSAGNTSLIRNICENINYIQDGALASPIGTVKYSLLTLVQFQAIVGSGWVLCDGSSCNPSDYHTLTGITTVKDYRGYFLAGNKGSLRGDGKGIQYNVADLSSGSAFADSNQYHNHPINYTTTAAKDHGKTNGPYYVGVPDGVPGGLTGLSFQLSTPLGGNVGTEFQPKHIVVNFFIKINNASL
jgi:hypothetical protein